MHFAHAQTQSYTGMAISCGDLISVCRMHFLGHVISPQGSARGCHESRWLYCSPPPPHPPTSSSGQSLARQQDMADLAAILDYTHDSGCRLAVTVQSRIQFVFIVLFSFGFVDFFGEALSQKILSKWLNVMFWNANTCSLDKKKYCFLFQE